VQWSVLDDLRMYGRAHVAETWRRPPTRRSRYLLMPMIPCLEGALLWARLQMMMPSQTITPVIAVIWFNEGRYGSLVQSASRIRGALIYVCAHARIRQARDIN
jgi:hypothetical protein